MEFHKNCTSIRIVSVDYYMSKPDPDFDVCYSEFRGSEVRQVPVIRLFGSSIDGRHSCVHIHGVFPYFYIPYYGSSVERLTVDQKIYQLASALDKAINVSLARSMSQAKHIFKITLVKGVPFYGYHHNAHHYLKIYMYNPQLVRNATQLLMNGTILSGTHQVHETHIPYILQFFIDYNLYGMSFLDLGMKHLRERTNDTDKIDNSVQKMSTSEYEIDVHASDILNREPDDKDDDEFANPGIAFIWKDEQARRRLLHLEQPDRTNLSQESGLTKEVVTESDRFYKGLLSAKLSKEYKPSSSGEDRKKVPISTYPSEVIEGEKLLNASYITNHDNHSNDTLNASQISYHFDISSAVDEDKIVSMSQNPDVTLDEEDYKMLEIMRQLEEQETDNIESDCLLAPCTQMSGGLNHSRLLNASLRGDLQAVCLMTNQTVDGATNPSDTSLDSDDEFFLDLTQKKSYTENGNEVESGQYFCDNGDDFFTAGLIPQLDGGDDLELASKRSRVISEESEERKEDESQQNVSAKRARIDLKQPVSRKSVTPRKVTFTLPPTETDHDRAKILLQQFEDASPKMLKNLEIRVPKLNVIKKSILIKPNDQSKERAMAPNEIPLKMLEVRLTKLDHGAYGIYEIPSPNKHLVDPYQQARDYDRINHFDPKEGPSTPSSKRMRKKGLTKERKDSPAVKRLKLEEEEQIEVILSEKFKNIVRLSPKVLIKPLTCFGKAEVNCELVLSDFSSQRAKRREDSLATVEESSSFIKPTEEIIRSDVCSTKVETSTIVHGTDNSAALLPSSTPQNDVEVNKKSACNSSNSSNMGSTAPTDYDATIDKVCQDKQANTIVDVDDLSNSDEKKTDNTEEITISESDDELVIIEKCNGSKHAGDDISIDKIDKRSKLDVAIESQLDGVDELFDKAVDDKQKKDVQNVPEETHEHTDEYMNIQSFCEHTMVCELDDISSDSDGSCRGLLNHNDDESRIVISLTTPVPTHNEALRAIETFEIPAVVNRTPFYGDPVDETGRKEVGHTMLHIGGNNLHNIEDFLCKTTGRSSLKNVRYGNLSRTFGENINEVLGTVGSNGPNSDRMKELLASEDSVVITPCQLPPNRAEASSWVDKRCRKSQVDALTNVELDSPLKVKEAQTIMAIDDDAECSQSIATKVDSASALNLSVLITSVDDPKESNGNTTKQLVSKIMDVNSLDTSGATSSSGHVALTGNMSNMNENTVRNMELDASVPNEKFVLPSQNVEASNQSEIIEQSNANISTATPTGNSFGFKVNYENLQDAKPKCEYNYLTILSLEIHVNTRGDLRPNPSIDPIAAIFYRIHNDVPSNHPKASPVCGVILNRDQLDYGNNAEARMSFKYNQSPYEADVVLVDGERELYEKCLLLISFWDPDIFTGYEIESISWGYIIERGYALEMNLMKMLSRIPTAEKVYTSEEEHQELLEMQDYSTGLKIPGRILLDIWRLMRHEIALTSYTFENVVYHILHRRVSNHSFRQLSRLWSKSFSQWVVLNYYLERVNGNFEILNQLDLIGRTAELAKLFGIQFYEVLSRGSQFRVESMMLRIAKPRNFVSVSPSIQQRAHMRAPEYLPLIMEPNSRFYADPMIVLDFQSLYPSVIIAYNYCFSTCLGRIEHLGESSTEFEFGATFLRVPPKMLKALIDKDLVTFSPCGVAFVKKRVREGVMPRMLSEILNTRLMVKKSMKIHKDNSILQRVLHSRQLGLKLIANVTYGYTAANFSGRMPCVEIGDSVVAKGRETLERAIKLVEETDRWGAKVVYGDTDSMFVLCPGRTKEEAFRIGEEIAETVTNANPPPIKLKLEKVYQPSILQTKKRYVGYMFETVDQKNPTYEAKGIETVRRDGCPVVAKMLEKVLRILFETCDVSKVKQYTCRQFTKILESRINLQDFIFAKEFRGEDGYKPGACVPALELTRKWKQTDPRREPRKGQRVPYVIINGPPLVPLIRLVRSPDEVIADESLTINANYYISKAIIPPLNRCLLLIGADVNQWYNELPRKTLMLHNTGGITVAVALPSNEPQMQKKRTITQYFSTMNCIVDCGRQTQHGLCKDCRQQPQRALVHVINKTNKLERKLELTKKMCRSCIQRTFDTACSSLDCPVMFSLKRCSVENKQAQYYRDLIEEMF